MHINVLDFSTPPGITKHRTGLTASQIRDAIDGCDISVLPGEYAELLTKFIPSNEEVREEVCNKFIPSSEEVCNKFIPSNDEVRNKFIPSNDEVLCTCVFRKMKVLYMITLPLFIFLHLNFLSCVLLTACGTMLNIRKTV